MEPNKEEITKSSFVNTPETTESVVDSAPESMPTIPPISYNTWLQKTVFDFLDIADMPSQHDRRNALIATKLDEEGLVACFNLAESLFTVEYAYACEIGDEEGVAHVELYRGKAETLKTQMGLKS